MKRALSKIMVCALVLCGLSGQALGAGADFYLDGGGGQYKVPTKTWLDNRYKTVVRQQYDYSCGSAAVATLLSYHYNHPVPERDVLKAMFEVGDQDKIRREGFSLLDMKKYLESIGYGADGFRDSLNKLVRVGVPAIVLLNIKGYLHFVVVKGVTDQEVLVGDPSHGLRTIKRKEFEDMWNGVLFVINDHMEVARRNFNSGRVWSARARGRFSTPLVNDELGTYTIIISNTPNYY